MSQNTRVCIHTHTQRHTCKHMYARECASICASVCKNEGYDAGTLLQHTTPQIMFCYRRNMVSIWIQEYGFIRFVNMQYTQSCGIWRCLVAWPRDSDCSYLFHIFLDVFHVLCLCISYFSICIPYFLYVFHIVSQLCSTFSIILPHSGYHEIHILSLSSTFIPYLFHIFQEKMEIRWR